MDTLKHRDEILKLHESTRGKLTIKATMPITEESLPMIYTPGVAEVCKEISNNPESASKYTIAGKTVAVITNGTSILGLGDIGIRAGAPVMEGKCVLFKELAGVEAFPIGIEERDPVKFISHVKAIASNFAAINLEDISAPDCFPIERGLNELLNIPVMHDDQHATAIAVLAGLKGAIKLTGKRNFKIVIAGAGAAGNAITHLLSQIGVIRDLTINEIVVTDSKGIIAQDRSDLDEFKRELQVITNRRQGGSLQDALRGADVFIGVSTGNLLKFEDIQLMNPEPVIFALANPTPEIMPDLAYSAGAKIVATGRSDLPNQINNALVFPGLFKGLIRGKIRKVDTSIKLAVVETLYRYHEPKLAFDSLLPPLLDLAVPAVVADTISRA